MTLGRGRPDVVAPKNVRHHRAVSGEARPTAVLKMVIDGRWAHDFNNPTVERNEYGELNSIVEITQ